PNKHWVCLSNGSNAFVYTGAPWIQNWAGPNNHELVGDFNGDGRTDLLSYSLSPNKHWVCLSNGSNAFVYTGAPWIQNWAGPNNHELVGDFNGDGYDDLLSYNDSTGSSWVAINQRNGTFRYDNNPLVGWGIQSGGAAKIATPDESDTVQVIDAQHASVTLNQNYPNPFNPSTTISFSLPETAEVSLSVYNVLGQRVALLVDHQVLAAGDHSIEWNAGGKATGVYIYHLETGTTSKSNKMLLLK
ncbi:MAG: FG-GAP-like repeat-containing protein, partial [Patescibacteria group bacterium]